MSQILNHLETAVSKLHEMKVPGPYTASLTRANFNILCQHPDVEIIDEHTLRYHSDFGNITITTELCCCD